MNSLLTDIPSLFSIVSHNTCTLPKSRLSCWTFRALVTASLLRILELWVIEDFQLRRLPRARVELFDCLLLHVVDELYVLLEHVLYIGVR